ncbi:hypothetical protein BD309DRAFT_677586 [Dichomitus squalens]|uniref:Uncharacterized protein n=1 Tax=Dichomitus squalens TaxID=114155 RepID=A0A4Q9Q0G3_9APHY|nr:hypothetical protein BD309DRAFT_677586 [Dichomitus squalens]TBU60632.1 hypothetical protein BD310DRAFT_922335 [Dichomitus squalens]
MTANARSVVSSFKHAARQIQQSRGGRTIGIGSVSSKQGRFFTRCLTCKSGDVNVPAYAASKSAICGPTQCAVGEQHRSQHCSPRLIAAPMSKSSTRLYSQHSRLHNMNHM